MIFLAAYIRPPGSGGWVTVQAYLGFHFMLVLEKLKKPTSNILVKYCLLHSNFFVWFFRQSSQIVQVGRATAV